MTDCVIEIPNLSLSVCEKIKTLQGLVQLRKTTLTRLLGPDDGTASGLLIKKLDSLIITCTEYPELSSTQTQAIKGLICQLSVNTERTKNDLCAALADISSKCNALTVPQDHKNTL